MVRAVVVAGTFDVLHKGHIEFFRQAKSYGDRLVVIIARDENVRRLKGINPMHDENERLRQVIDAGIADDAMLGFLADPYTLIEELNPDVICLGYDQAFFADRLAEELLLRGIAADIVRLEAYQPDIYKSSIIKKCMQR